MKAITTKYHGPGNVKGSRISATDQDGNRITLSYDNASKNPHWDAAKALCDKLGWRGALVEGALSTGCVFVFLPCRGPEQGVVLVENMRGEESDWTIA